MSTKIAKSLISILFLSIVHSPWSIVHSSPKNPHHPLSEALLITKAISHIHRYYFDPARIDPNAMFEGALRQLQKSAPEILAKCDKPKFCTVTVKQAARRFGYPGPDLNQLKNRFKEMLPFIAQHIDPDTEKEMIEYAVIIGMLDELDPHSNFMSPDSYREFRVGTEGEFGGLGIVISIKEGHLTVTAPLEGTPAWRAGIKPKDHILQIDVESTINMSLTEAVERLRGKVGTKVTLKLEREGKKEPIFLTLTRAVINIQSVQSKLVKTPQGTDVGFIRVKNFQGNTDRDVQKQLGQLIQKAPALKGVVLDLRNNPGGLLEQSVLLADIFLKKGVIVSTKGREGKLMDFKEAREEGTEGDWPLIVLVNEGSASASEIVAGALKNNNRALTVGTKTFGKGTVQSIFELPLDAAVKITVGEYLTPGEKSIQSIGITPDIELLGAVVDKEHLNTIENIQTFEKDLEKHLDAKSMQSEKPAYRLRYLAPTPKEEEEIEYTTEIQLKDDLAALLALQIIDASPPEANRPAGNRPAGSRFEMLKKIEPLLQKKQGEEEQKIAQAFQTLGVNWSVAPEKETPQAELAYHLYDKGTEIKQARAGQEVRLKIHLKNVGRGAFHRLAAQTDSKIYYFKNLEFAFGKVAPGETKIWETPLKIPVANLSEEIPLELKFEEGNKKTPPPIQIILPISELERPHFAHYFSLEPDAFDKLKKGGSTLLTVKVSNRGKGVAKKPLVAIRNLGGKEIFIEKGRAELGGLNPGETKEVQFRFHTEAQASETRASETRAKAIELELSIFDGDLLVESKQTLTLKPFEAALDPPQRQWYSPPVITLVQAKEKTNKSPFSLEGNARDDEIIRDVTIFVEEDKTFYESNAAANQQFHFKTLLPLKEGNNTVLITARDNYNLVSRILKVIRLESS